MTALTLKQLQRVEWDIKIVTSGFLKDRFFVDRDGVDLFFEDEFNKFEPWILGVIPDNIPAFHGTIMKLEPKIKWLYDPAILAELGESSYFSPAQVTAVIRELLLRQSCGRKGLLHIKGTNVFFVKPEDRQVFRVSISWKYYQSDVWYLSAQPLYKAGFNVASCVFVFNPKQTPSV